MNEPKKTIQVPTADLHRWVQSLREISEGPSVRVTTDHKDNLERSHDKACLLAKDILQGLKEVIGDV